MAGWPSYIAYAVKELDYQYPNDELRVEAFVSAWGGVDMVHLVNALQKAEDEDDILFALLAISFSRTTFTRALLASFFESVHPKARWVSAYCLGKQADERALPILSRSIQEFLPPQEAYITYNGQTYRDWFYDAWRPRLKRMIDEWNKEDQK